VPESFKVLVKELQSLCLDMKVLDASGNEIELRDDEDDMAFQTEFRSDDLYDGDVRNDGRDKDFQAAGFTFKESDDDDDLLADDGGDDDDFADGDLSLDIADDDE